MSVNRSISVRATALRLAFALAVGGCAAAPYSGPGVVAAAHVSVVNLTDYHWRIEITPASGTPRVTELIEPRKSAEVDIPGGSYRIEQSIEDPSDHSAAAARHFSAQLAAGKTYRWPLATLQSDNADERSPGG